MPSDALLFFKAFYSVVSEIYVYGEHPPDYAPVLQAELAGLDPMAANELVQEKLQDIHPDEQLLALYEDISDFQQQHLGDVYPIEEDNSWVTATAEAAKRIGGADGLNLKTFPKFVAALKQAFHDQHKVAVLERYIAVNRAALHEYRFKKLEEQIVRNGVGHVKEEEAATPGEFTHTQQAIAIHYLIHEVFQISGVDNARLMEFAHLLAAKKIPLHKETGKENLRNSGIKSAFNKAWNKEDANHLADLRFVLRFFKPLDVEGAGIMHQGVASMEKRIAKLSEKLSKGKD